MKPSRDFSDANRRREPVSDNCRESGPSRVLSVRVTPEERRRLEREAAGQPLSSHVRAILLGGRAASRRAGKRGIVSDHEALARVLSALGRSPQVGTLKGVLAACDEGAIILGREAEDALRVACANIVAMREDLIRALGLKPE
ncbi:MAG: hypothetical protein AAF074_05265 [Pseudomonadota bacterium]